MGAIRTKNFKGFGVGGYTFGMGMGASGKGMQSRWQINDRTGNSGLIPTSMQSYGEDTMFVTASGSPKLYTFDYGTGNTTLEYTSAETVGETSTLIMSQEWYDAVGVSDEKRTRYVWTDNDGIGDAYYDAGWIGRDRTPAEDGDGVAVDCEFANAGYTGYRPVDRYDNYLLFGDKNKIASLFLGNSLVPGLVWENNAVVFPFNWEIVGLKTGTNGVLVAANIGRSGIIRLIGADSDGVGFDKKGQTISLHEKIQAIAEYKGEWIVVGDRGIYWTNGYQISEIVMPVDPSISDDLWDVNPNGVQIISNQMVISNNKYLAGQKRTGFYIIDLKEKLMSFLSSVSKSQVSEVNGCVSFNDNTKRFVVNSDEYIGEISNGNSEENSFYISEEIDAGDNEKTADKITVVLGGTPYASFTNKGDIDTTVDVKLMDNRRNMWYSTSSQTTTGASATEIYIRDDIAELGDEVEILDGESATETRHITSITPSGVDYILGLDEPLLNGVAINDTINISPFKKLKTITASNEVKKEDISVPSAVTGRRFYIKLVVNGVAKIHSINLEYNELD